MRFDLWPFIGLAVAAWVANDAAQRRRVWRVWAIPTLILPPVGWLVWFVPKKYIVGRVKKGPAGKRY